MVFSTVFHCFPLFSTVFHCSTALNHGEKPQFFTSPEALRASPTGAVPGGAGPSRRRGAKGAAATAALGAATWRGLRNPWFYRGIDGDLMDFGWIAAGLWMFMIFKIRFSAWWSFYVIS